MVRFCSFPGCEKKMKRNTPETFHRLPFHCPRDIVNMWLQVLQVDINTPTETLRLKDYRICSDHFDDGDFRVPTKLGIPKKSFLVEHAIPRAVGLQVALERVETSGCHTEICLEDTKLFGVPQSTPKQSDHTQTSQSPGLRSALALSLTNPVQATVSPSSGTYMARPPTWRLSEGSSTTSVLHSTDSKAASGVVTQQREDKPSLMLSFKTEPKQETLDSDYDSGAQCSLVDSEMTSVKLEDCSQTLGLNVIIKDEEEEEKIGDVITHGTLQL
ncbi:hypothetical protein UPYG_G00159890 [Umbra pygmaea]|uniref:THAP domain-containing protein 1 n=1 Tax=Umbra pygmaea TaxID=75934 RepID=A0ABD0WZ06_UMBPY